MNQRRIASKYPYVYDIQKTQTERLVTYTNKTPSEIPPAPVLRQYQVQRRISIRDPFLQDIQRTVTDRLITHGDHNASGPLPFEVDKTWWRKMLWNSCTGLIGGEVCWQFEHWTKRYHCYTYHKPNPTVTAKVLAARDKFRQAMNAWKALSNLEREQWEEFYKLRNYTGKNKFISKFILGLPLEIDKYRY